MYNYIVDGHCDTLLKIGKSFRNLDIKEGDLYKNSNCSIDIDRMIKSSIDLQFMAVFVDQIFNPNATLKVAMYYIDLLLRKIEENKEYVSLITNFDDILNNKNNGKTSLLLAIEGGEVLSNEVAILRILHRIGVRCITLTWNYRNNIADGVLESSTSGGLTNYGREVVQEMNKLGIIIDVSHISEKGFWDVISMTKSPIIASHSNSYNLCNHPRNLKDSQIKAIANLNGVIGINYSKDFLEKNPEDANIKSIVNHIEYISEIGGINCVGLGSDFDGTTVPKDIGDISMIYKIKNEMIKRGFSEYQISKVMGNNFIRVIKDVIK